MQSVHDLADRVVAQKRPFPAQLSRPPYVCNLVDSAPSEEGFFAGRRGNDRYLALTGRRESTFN